MAQQSIILENNNGDKAELKLGDDGWLYYGPVGGPYMKATNILKTNSEATQL